MLNKEDTYFFYGAFIGMLTIILILFFIYHDVKESLVTVQNQTRDYRYYADKYRNEALIYKALFTKLQDIRTHELTATAYFSNDGTAIVTGKQIGRAHV